MPRFKVTIIERRVWLMSKVFKARTENEARLLAEGDESWTTADGWEPDGESAGESGIELVVRVKGKKRGL